ncbi:MAG: alpha/beta fold hydrolase [Bacteroidetes bacterium]|nr:alpha/beta fold hydrolase [Bacteroidota bacterium]
MILHTKIEGTGKPIVILHGLFGMLDNWNGIARQLSTKGIACILMDLRNHGHSPWSDEFNYHVMCEDVLETIAHLELNSYVLAGHSMGGKVALQVAACKPAGLLGLCVMDIAPRYYAPHHEHIINALYRADVHKIKSRKEAESNMKPFIADNATLQFLLKNLHWKDHNTLAWRFNLDAIARNIEEVGKSFSLENKMDTPTLFMRGENSSYINKQDEEHIQQLFTTVKLVTISHAGHWLHADQPEVVINTLEAFVNECLL